MKFSRLTFIALVSLACGSLAAAAPYVDNNMIGLKTANGKLAYDFINLWFNEHRGAEAFDKYVSRTDYMNHAVYSASVNVHKTFEQEKEEEVRAIPPNTRFVFKQLIAQGEYVFAHINAFPDASVAGPGDEMLMWLRIKNGKVLDHWDLHVEMKPNSVVFSRLDRFTTAVVTDRPSGVDPKTVNRNMIGLTTAEGKVAHDFVDLWFNQHMGAEAFDRYVHRTDYMNHAVYSSTSDKPKTFEEEKAEESRMGANPAVHFDIKQVIAQGGLVFVHAHTARNAANPWGREMVMLLRVRDGKITDHWDVHTALKEDSAVFEGLDR